MIKPLETKENEKIMKAVRQKWPITYRGKTIWMTVDFSPEIMKARNKRNHIFKSWTSQFRILYPAKMFYKKECVRDFQVKEN